VILNDALCRRLGFPREELIGKSDYDISPKEQADVFWERDQLVLETGQTDVNEEEVTWSGELRVISTKKSLYQDPVTHKKYIVATIRDITERKRAEEALERRALQLQTAAEVSRAVSSILDPDELIQQVVDLAHERFNLYYAGLFLVDETGEWAVLRAGTGEAGQRMLEQGHKLKIGGDSMIGQCVADQQARIALDVGEEAVRFDNPFLPETRSELALPLISRGRAIGALTIQSSHEAAFSEGDIAVLQTMADQLANAIENAHLHQEMEKALRELAYEQLLLRAIMENIPDHIYFKDTESRFLRINKAQADWFGLSEPEQAVGKTDFDFFTEEHARPAYEDEQEIIRSGRPIAKEEKETWPDGRETWVLTTKMPLRDAEGRIIGTFGISRDITERKRAEEALREAHEELEQYTARLERRTAQLQVGAEVAREAAAILDVHQLLDTTVRLISDRFGFYHAGVFLIDERREYAVLRAASSEGGRHMLERGYKLQVGKVGIVGHVAETGEPRIALDVGADAVFFNNPYLPDTRSEMGLPLKVRGRTVGVLDVQSTQEAAFSEDDVAVLQTLADQLAVAIENARLMERTEAQLRELSLLHGEYSAAAWARLTSPEQSLGYVYDRIDVMPAEQIPTPLAEVAVERGETVAIIEPDRTEKALVTPLKLHDRIIGTLGIQKMDGGQQWSPSEIALIEAVSEQVGRALENARLFVEAQRSAQQMQALYETSRALSSSLDEEALMRTILDAVYRTLDCEYVILSTVDEEAGTIGTRHGIWHGEFDVFPEWIGMAQYPLDHPDILADIYRTGNTEIIGEWDERFNRQIWDQFGHERFLRIFMPIKMRDRVIGVVEVSYDKHEKSHISEEEVQMLAAFMDQAAVALENARLFEQAQRQARRERQIYEIATRIRRSPDVATVLQTTVEELGRALQVDRAVVRLATKSRKEQS